MKITKNIEVDLARRGVCALVDAAQNDANAREISLALKENGKDWNVPAGVTCAVAYRKPDKTAGLYDTLPDGTAAIAASESTITAILAPQVLTCPGKVEAAVVLVESATLNRITTFPFTIMVTPDPSAGQSVSNDYYAYSTMEAVSTQLEKVESMMDLVGYAFGASTHNAYAHDAAVSNYINPLNRWFFSAILKDTWLKEVELYLQPISADAKVTVELWEKKGDTLQYSKSRSFSVPKTLTAGYHKVPVEAKLDGEWMVSVRPSGYNVCGIAAGQTCRYTSDLESKTLSYSALSSFAAGGFAGRLITAVYEAKTDVKAAPKTVLFVGPGQIYETIQDALDSITDEGTYTILVYPQAEPYSRFSMIRKLDAAYPWTGVTPKNVSIIALDPAHTAVRTDTNNYDTPPAELLCNGTIQGITFLSTYDQQDSAATKPAYAAHIDTAPTGAYTMVLENCRFISYAAPAVGIGVHQDGHLVFRNCQFQALGEVAYAPHEGYNGMVSGYGGVYVHTSTKAGVTGQHITFDNCRVVAPSHTYGIALLQAGSFNADDCEFTVTAHNTHIYAPAATKRCAISNGITLDPASFGNNSTNLNASEITA